MPKIVLETFDDMLNFDTKEPTAGSFPEMSFDRMEVFPGDDYPLYEGQRLNDMVESIRQVGILLPIILWHTDDNRYVILSGKNRRNAGKIAGLSKGPVIIKENLTYSEAELIVDETNLNQRSFTDLTHSQRARSLARHYTAIKSQGKRMDLINEIEQLLNAHNDAENQTSSDTQTKLRSDEKLGQNYGLSRDKIAKYIRLASLSPSLLNQVDAGNILFLAAYELSFVEDSNIQQHIADYMEADGYRLDHKKAHLLREYFADGKLSERAIVQILSGEKTRKPKSNVSKPFQLKSSVVSQYFKQGQSKKEIEQIIEKALAQYFAGMQE